MGIATIRVERDGTGAAIAVTTGVMDRATDTAKPIATGSPVATTRDTARAATTAGIALVS